MEGKTCICCSKFRNIQSILNYLQRSILHDNDKCNEGEFMDQHSICRRIMKINWIAIKCNSIGRQRAQHWINTTYSVVSSIDHRYPSGCASNIAWKLHFYQVFIFIVLLNGNIKYGMRIAKSESIVFHWIDSSTSPFSVMFCLQILFALHPSLLSLARAPQMQNGRN